MNILLIEDDAPLQQAIGEFFNKCKFKFDLASNGFKATELALNNSGQYDLCLIDPELIGFDGFEITRILRKKVRFFPILAMTGNRRVIDQSLAAGMDDFLVKPFNTQKLLQKIRELTIKSVRLEKRGETITLRKETPVDAAELQELKELDKKGLTKFSLIDINQKFIVHKNIQNKISHDIIGSEKQLSEFLDRSPDSPGVIHLYASNLHANKRYILPEHLEKLIEIEDAEVIKYVEKSEFPENKELES